LEDAKRIYDERASGQIQLIKNFFNPWTAVKAKYPSYGDTSSTTARPGSTFNLVTNASGNLVMVFDPTYVGAGSFSAFAYNNRSGLDGSSITAATWTGGPVSSAPLPPISTFDKMRLVCAGIKATVNQSSLNIVGTAYTCVMYGDLTPVGVNVLNSSVPDGDTYQVFANILNGNRGMKFDIDNNHTNVLSVWLPTDPLSEVFLHPNDYINDQAGHPAGGFAKFVIAFQGLPANSPVNIDVVWNFENLATGNARAWLQSDSKGPLRKDHEGALDHVTKHIGDKSAFTQKELDSYMQALDIGREFPVAPQNRVNSK